MKKAIFLGPFCSDKVFYEILENTTQFKPNIAGQRHVRMLVEGLFKAGLNIEAISMLPTAPRPYYNKVLSKYKKETVNNVKVKYVLDINIKIIKQFSRSIIFAFLVFKWLLVNRKHERLIILSNIYPPTALITLMFKPFFKFKTVAYVTDVSECRYDYNLISNLWFYKKLMKCFKKLSLFLDNKFDAYIFITKEMSDIINTRKKPFIVSECMIESSLTKLDNDVQKKSWPPAIMYAGGISRKYGINLLIESIKFIEKDIPFELWIFGTGSDVDLVIEASKNDPRIKYYGVVRHSILMEYETKATLMINPRPSFQSFTKYSFPSKTVEYMASGTPIISTKLECIPMEYHEYIIFIDKETPEGIGHLISDCLKMDKKLLHSKGMKARNFVLDNKNYIIQTKKIFDFLNSVFES